MAVSTKELYSIHSSIQFLFMNSMKNAVRMNERLYMNSNSQSEEWVEARSSYQVHKNDKRLYELYILFRIKLLLSAESKLRERIDDEIEKK